MMKKAWIRQREAIRLMPWQGKPHRFFYWFCVVCLSVYIAYVAYLSQSGLFMSKVDTKAALLWFAAFACAAFAGLVWLSHRPVVAMAKAQRGRIDWRVWLLGTGISMVILAVYLMASYPGGVSVDSAVQWTQANTGVYSNWHPVFHTLLLHLVVLIKPLYSLAVLLQCAVASVAIGYLVATLHAWGMKLWPLLLVSALLTASPIVGHTMMYLWKDNAMTIGVLILTAQAVNLYYSRGEWLGRLIHALAFGLALAFTTMVRHNAFFFTLPLLISTALVYRGQLKGAIQSCAVLLVAAALVWGPLFSSLGVTYPANTMEESIGVPMTIISDVRKLNPDALDTETRLFTDRMAGEQGWKSYNLHSYNSIKFGATREVISRTTIDQVLRMTLHTIQADPRTSFQAVNGVTDLVWGIKDEGEANLVVRNSGDLPSVPKETGIINQMGTAIKSFVTAPLALPPINWYVGNLGVSFLLMLVAAVAALRRNGTSVLTLCLPTLLYNLGTMCLLCGNDARFFSYSPLICTFSLFVLLRDAQPQTTEGKKLA